MQYRTLGKTGIQVSCLCYGAMSFGGDADEQTSALMFHRCRDSGINFFDCANVYQNGLSEQILGKLIGRHRDDIVLTSKVCMPMGEDPNARGLSRRHIMQAVEASLRRLQTDRLDLYFVHHVDGQTDMEVTLATFNDLVRQGKILHPAVSNWSSWQIARSLGIAEHRGLARFECIQPMYNLVKRQAEVEILPLAQAEQLGVINYSPLGGGLLTGKYGANVKPESGRIVDNLMYGKRYGAAINFEIAERFKAYATECGEHPVSLAVAWTMAHPAVTAPIIGARNLEQLEPSLAAVNIDMTPQRRTEIAALSPAPPTATDRAEEQEG